MQGNDWIDDPEAFKNFVLDPENEGFVHDVIRLRDADLLKRILEIRGCQGAEIPSPKEEEEERSKPVRLQELLKTLISRGRSDSSGCIQVLLDFGACPNLSSPFGGMTPMGQSVACSNPHIVKTLAVHNGVLDLCLGAGLDGNFRVQLWMHAAGVGDEIAVVSGHLPGASW